MGHFIQTSIYLNFLASSWWFPLSGHYNGRVPLSRDRYCHGIIGLVLLWSLFLCVSKNCQGHLVTVIMDALMFLFIFIYFFWGGLFTTLYPAFLIKIIIMQKICSAHISTLLGAQGVNPETPGQAPFSLTISVLGSFTCMTQPTGPTALWPIRRTKYLWFKCLAQGHKDRDSNPHSDNTRTWVQCTRPLGHDTP